VHASPHSALISLLHTLSREPHRGLRRLNPRRRRQLLSGLLEWVCGDKGKGPHPTVLARRGLMRRYAALLSALIDDWPGDMEVSAAEPTLSPLPPTGLGGLGGTRCGGRCFVAEASPLTPRPPAVSSLSAACFPALVLRAESAYGCTDTPPPESERPLPSPMVKTLSSLAPSSC
jgi:hypothetical protein